jgi:hypothetical protein
MGAKIAEKMKQIGIIAFLIGVFLATWGCEKRKEIKSFEKKIINTEWKLDKVIDTNGLDIRIQYLQDSSICECIQFNKTKKSNQFNTLLYKCKNTLYESYSGIWEIKTYEDQGNYSSNLLISKMNSERIATNQFSYITLRLSEEQSNQYLIQTISGRVGTYSTKIIYTLYYKKIQ